MVRKGSITIVGGGPGDPELITLKGLKALRKAQVVLYDSLIPHALLQYVHPSCKLIFVGKRRSKQEFSQEEINDLMVYYAQRYDHVVRLKGGDPFVFGRGHEELEFALSKGFSVNVVPGISSALAGPLSAGIPVTKRGVNESFWVVTGTVSSGELSNDLLMAARSSATIIVLMGLSHLHEIAAMIVNARGAHEPFAIIQNATLPTQKTIIAVAGTVMEEAANHQVGTPAVIVIGKVVAEQHIYDALVNHGEIKSIKS